MNTDTSAIPENLLSSVPNDRWLDANHIRIGQFLTVSVVTAAFILDRWELVAFQCGVFILSVISSNRLDIYSWIYKGLLKPLGILKTDMRIDNVEAYRFSNMIGIVVSGTAAYLIYSGESAMIGWGLVWLMITLGSLAYFGWCAGCFVYYMIQKMGAKGFFRHKQISNKFPGVRSARS